MSATDYENYEPISPSTPANNSRRTLFVLGGCLAIFLCVGCFTLGLGYYAWTQYGDEILSEFATATPERRNNESEATPTRGSSGGREGAITPTAAIAEVSTLPPTTFAPATATPEPFATALPPNDENIDAVIPAEIEQQPLPIRAEADLDLLYASYYPEHDYFETAVRLGQEDLGARTVTGGQYTIGDTQEFYNGDDQIDATLALTTENVYFWVEDGLDLNQAELTAVADRFENEFYPQLIRLFGELWTPGIDGDPRFSILHAKNGIDEELGRFSSEDEFPKSLYRTSNEQELIYLNMGELSLGSDLYFGTLVHEVQHLIQWYVDPSETVWLNEGLSQLAEIYLGFDDTAPSEDYLEQPGTQLNSWDYEDEQVYAHYAGAYLFSVYLWEQLGDEAIQELVRHPANGMAAVWAILQGYRPDTSVEQFTAAWAAANYLDNEDAERPYYYQSLRINQPTISAKIDNNETLERLEAMDQFGVHYIDLNDLRGDTTITFVGDTAVNLIGAPPRSGEQMWYAPGVDDMNAQLTATFDLTGVSQATLKYAVWYELEEDYDYAYLSVSADGGQTWEILRPSHYSSGDYGPAYNGRSTNRNDAIDGWLKESVSLDSYVGQQIQIRFDVLTDGGITERGFAIDDIAIPELGYETNVESGADGWQADGFVQTGWQIPQRWSVLLIEDGPRPVVTPLLLNQHNQLFQTLPIGKGGGVLVIMPQTPFTNETATYWLTVSQ